MNLNSHSFCRKALWWLPVLLLVNSIQAQTDTVQIYKKIKEVAERRTITTWIYHAIFIDPAPKEYPVAPEEPEKRVNPYLKHKDQVIRNVNIKVYNPFGHLVGDTVLHTNNFLEIIANHVHINTRHWIVINRLLFEPGDTLNALALSESERLLRQAAFINDARIFVSEIPHDDTLKHDEVDVTVAVYDKWAITMPMLVTPQGGNVRFRNQNLFGVGQQFEQYVEYKTPDVYYLSGYYNIANLDNTYISSQLSYNTSANGTKIGLSFDRPYFSPLAKWAGGLSVNHNWGHYTYTDTTDKLTKLYPLNTLNSDLWMGKTFKLGKTKTLFDQSTNIISGVRYYNTTFLERPGFDIDTVKGNAGTNAFVGNVGFSVQQYYKDRFIYRFGSNEDVPEGFIIQYIYGGLKSEFSPIKYFSGIEVARAKKFGFGYMNATISYGLFFNDHITNDITTKFTLNYLSNLAKKGRWYFREFINYNLVHGENKPSDQSLTISSSEMYGFSASTLSGTTKMIMNAEMVAYAPYNLIGFRFASVAMAGLSMLGSDASTLDKSPLYQAYSLGLMVRNENLVSSTFRISIGFYPFQPDGKNNVTTFNPVTSFTLRVRGFSMGRPEFITF